MHPHDRKIQNTSHNLNITWRIGSIYQKINSLNQHEWVWKQKFFNWTPFKVSINQFLPLLNGLCLVTELSLGCKIGCWWFRKKRIFRLKPNRSTLLLCYETNVCIYKPTHHPPTQAVIFLEIVNCSLFVEEHTSIVEVFCMKALPVVRPSHCFKTEVCYKTMHFLP